MYNKLIEMAKRDTIRDTSLVKVEFLRTEIQNTFQSLHISLDERESDLMYRIDEIRGTIVTALKQWNGRIEDVEHTIAHANTEIRDNTWGFKLLKEAREELNILEKAKPNFKVDFKMFEGINDVIANLGEVNIKQTNKQVNMRTELETNSLEKDEVGVFEFRNLQDSNENKFDLSEETFGNNIERKDKFEFETKTPIVPIVRNITGTKYKLVRSVSCAELTSVKPKLESNLNPQRAFDDSCITNREDNLQTNFQKAEFVKQEKKNIEMKKRTKTKRENPKRNKLSEKLSFFSDSFKTRTKIVNLATYKLSELKMHKYLTHRVTLTSRWNKNKQVHGILKCVVSRGVKTPIVGIQLDTNDGTSNGYYGGIQYFKTENHKAYFLPANEVFIII